MKPDLNDIYEEYLDAYIKHRKKEVQMDVLNSQLKQLYVINRQDTSERLLKNNLVVTEYPKRKYKAKEEIYDYLEDRGLLPLSVKLSTGLEQYFNLNRAKINFRKSLRAYPGRRQVIDKKAILNHYGDIYKTYELDRLSEEFYKEYSNSKLLKGNLETIKKSFIEILENEGIHSLKTEELGTIKLTETYDYDPYIIYDFVTGKKEMYVRETGDNFEIVIFPDEKKGILPKNYLLNNIPLIEYTKNEELKTSKLIKKREFNRLIKEGYKGYAFEIPVDPSEFFRSQEISRTKIMQLADMGYLDEEEINEYFEVEEDPEDTIIQIVTKGTAEKRRDLFLERLAKKAERLSGIQRPEFNNSLIDVQLDDFTF